MNLLLDTHILLWAAGQPERLAPRARERLLDPVNSLAFSSASLWEIVIKRGLGRSDFNVDPRRLWRLLLANGYRELSVTTEHTLAIGDLPDLHRDPFDRILIAQARVEGLLLLTADEAVGRYGEGICKI